jgi:hypothetical protein
MKMWQTWLPRSSPPPGSWRPEGRPWILQHWAWGRLAGDVPWRRPGWHEGCWTSIALSPRTRDEGLKRKGNWTVLFFRTSLSVVGVSLNPLHLLEIHRTVTWWFILTNHQDLAKDGTRVVGGDVDLNLLKLAAIWRRGSSCGTREPLLVDLLPQVAGAEGMSCALW